MDKNILLEHIHSDKPIIYDIGCHDGTDTLEFLDVFPGATVYAFEGDLRSIQLFKKRINNEHIQLIEGYLSDSKGKKTIYESNSETRRRNDENFWSASTSLKQPKKHIDIFPDVFFETSQTETDTLNTIVSEYKLALPDVIWIDVNGAECEVIKGGADIIKHAEIIVIEFEETELFEGSMNKEETLSFLPEFELLGVYDFLGNFGNMLLKRKK